MSKHLPCGCEYEPETGRFVHICEACQAAIAKQKAHDAAVSKMTLEQRVLALENHVWRK